MVKPENRYWAMPEETSTTKIILGALAAFAAIGLVMYIVKKWVSS